MKITIFNGSPKANHGNTHVMVENFLQGAAEAGAEVEQVFLAKHKIHPCTSCKSCWERTPGKCAQRDGMDELVPKIISSDIIGFATPVFVDNVTGIMKNFMDRMIVIGDPHWEKDELGECRHLLRYEKPAKFVAISNCGFPEQSHFQVLRLLFRRMARNLNWQLAGEIYRGGGALLKSTDENMQPYLNNYKKLLVRAGREIILYPEITEETTLQLEKPLLPLDNFTDIFLNRVNQISDERIARLQKS